MLTDWSRVTWYYVVLAVIVFWGAIIGAFFLGKEHGAINNVPAQPEKIETTSIELVGVDPTINQIIRSSDGSDYNNETRSFYRLLVRNTEYDPCLTLEEVTVYAETGPAILNSYRLCDFSVNGDRRSIIEGVDGVDYVDLQWDAAGLRFGIDLYEDRGIYSCIVRDLADPVIQCT